MRFAGRSASPALKLVVLLASAWALAAPAAALEEPANERDKLKECEKRLCTLIVKKEATPGDLTCALSKTWSKDKIKEGIEKKKVSWSLGDARCAVDLAVPNATIVDAVAKPAHTLEFPKHAIKCEVEREKEITAVTVNLQPKIEFKDGKAVKALLGLKEIEAPTVIKGAIWTVATVEDTVGLFHSDILSEVNEFIATKCPKALQ